MKINNKFAIGCITQWYEIEIIEEYLQSLKNSVDVIENKENVVIDLYFNCSQELEKIDKKQISISEIKQKYEGILEKLFGDLDYGGYNIKSHINEISNSMYTIADYRREFNDKYCTEVDVLMWGETDALLPIQTFQILDNLHTQVKNTTPKYVTFFSICKMWDESWKILEHPDFTDKPHIDNDYDNWWSLKYTMSLEEMYKINDKVDELDVKVLNQFKFNGCGLVISSEIVKSGANIPRSVFFVHEDTSFQNMMIKLFDNRVPQYLIKNILLVHNRNHPKKRMYVEGERLDGTMNEKRRSNEWYVKANKMSEHNTHNIFNQGKAYNWNDVWEKTK